MDIFADEYFHTKLIFQITESPHLVNSSLTSRTTVNECKDYFLSNRVGDFHYVNAKGVKDIYGDTFKEAVVKQILLEVSNESSFKLSASLAKAFSSISDEKEAIKWVTQNSVPDISDKEMLRRYIEHGIKNETIAVGLEVLDPNLLDLAELNKYDQDIKDLSSKFTLLPNEIERHRLPIKKRAAGRIIDRLCRTGGWVLVGADFFVNKIEKGEFTFEYVHPVSTYNNVPIKITILEVSESEMERGYARQYSKFIGKFKSMNIFGQVFQAAREDTDPMEFMITPFAIY